MLSRSQSACSRPLNILHCIAGDAEATQQYADMMWRPGSPQGYQPPSFNSAHSMQPSQAPALQQSGMHTQHSFASPFQQQSTADFSRKHSSTAMREPSRVLHSQPQSLDSTRPGTPPSSGAPLHAFPEPECGYQPLLEPLLPVSSLPQPGLHQSSPQQAQRQQHDRLQLPYRARSFGMMPSVPAPLPPVQRPASHSSHSPQPSENSQSHLQVCSKIRQAL